SARAGHVAAGSEDFRRALVLDRVFVRAVRRAAHRLGWTAGGVPVGDRLRDRAVQLRPDQLFLLEEPQFLTCSSSSSESVTGPRRSSCASGSIFRRAAWPMRSARWPCADRRVKPSWSRRATAPSSTSPATRRPPRARTAG